MPQTSMLQYVLESCRLLANLSVMNDIPVPVSISALGVKKVPWGPVTRILHVMYTMVVRRLPQHWMLPHLVLSYS